MTDYLRNATVRFRGCKLGPIGRGTVLEPSLHDGRVLVRWHSGGDPTAVRRESIEVCRP